MIGRIALSTLARASRTAAVSCNAASVVTRPQTLCVAPKFFATLKESTTAHNAWQRSCYFEINFTIPEEATVYEAVQRFAAYDIGCLVTTNANGEITGVISERDYVCKIALLGRSSKETKVKEINTKSRNLITATTTDTVDACMHKMLSKGIRHLPLLDDGGKVIGMLSIKDLVRTLVQEKEETIKVLSDFALGKGGHFGSE